MMRLAPMFASVAAFYDHRRGLSPRPPREGGRPKLCTLQCGDKGVTDPQKVAQLVEEKYVPVISQMPGFVAYYCVDAGDGVMVSTSVFEHKDAEEQSTFRAGEIGRAHV